MSTPDEIGRKPGWQSSVWLDSVFVMLTWAIGIALYFNCDRTCYPIRADSVKYFGAAENFVAGRGLVHSPHSPIPYDEDLEPLKLWPPGLPLLIASLSYLGLDPYSSAVWIPRVSWLLATPIAVWVFRSLGIRMVAGPLALLSMLSDGVFGSSATVLSDVPYLLLTLLCLLFFFLSIKSDANILFAISSGLSAAAAYSVRNVGLSLLLAIPVTLIFLVLLRMADRRQALRVLAFWIGGAIPIVAALKARNLLVFGAFEPYSMGPSTVGVIHNIRWMMFGILDDLSGVSRLSEEIAWNRWWFASTALAGSCAFLMLSGKWFLEQMKTNATEQCALGLALGVYCAGGIALVIMARSRYEWGELINCRHAGQYNLFVLALCAAGLETRFRDQGKTLCVSLGMLLVPLFLFRMIDIPIHWRWEPTPGLLVAKDQEVISTLRSLPKDAMIISNDGPLLTSVSGRSVRNINPAEGKGVSNPFEPELNDVTSDLRGSRPIYIGFVATESTSEENAYLSHMPDEYRSILQKPYFWLFVFEGDRR